MSKNEEIDIVYIASFSFSGSTLLDYVLGGNSKLVSTGELHIFNINKNTYSKEGEGCTCGASEAQCEYWKSVRQNFTSFLEANNLKDEYQLPILNKFKIYSPQFSSNYPQEKLLAYQRTAYFLYKSIIKSSGKPVIIDSSKNIPRLLALLSSPLFSVRIIYLQKKLDGIFESYKKRNRSTLTATMKWKVYYIQLSSLIMNYDLLDQTYFIKYEDYVLNPLKEIKAICKFLGIDYQDNMLNIQNNDRHIIGGNPMRYARQLGIDQSKIHYKQLSPLEKVLKRLLSRDGYSSLAQR